MDKDLFGTFSLEDLENADGGSYMELKQKVESYDSFARFVMAIGYKFLKEKAKIVPHPELVKYVMKSSDQVGKISAYFTNLKILGRVKAKRANAYYLIDTQALEELIVSAKQKLSLK